MSSVDEVICGTCLRGEHEVCVNTILAEPYCTCTHTATNAPVGGRAVGTIANALNLGIETPDNEEEPDSRKVSRRLKSPDMVTDQQSTGRKRAAAMYPLKTPEGEPIPCDLANKKAPTLPNYMEVQIDGCGVRPESLAGNAQARHHNNYNTLDNERENVLLLCHSCHNLLHAKNDPFKDVIYERIYGFKPTMEDLSHTAKALRSGKVEGGKIEKEA